MRRSGAKNWRSGAEDDYDRATDAINRVTDDPESIDLLFKLARRRCTILVEHYWPEIEALAQRLLRSRTKRLDGEAARSIWDQSLFGRKAGLMKW